MEIKIESCENGWIISHFEEQEEGKEVEEVKELILDGAEFEGITNLLRAVNNHFGQGYDKYGEKNLRISFDLRGCKLD